MWELDYKESWVPKNWCFWTVVLEKTLESPLDCKEIKPVNCKGNESWIFIGRTDVEAETPIPMPPDGTNWLIGKDPDAGKAWRREEKGTSEDEMVEWHHQLDEHEFEQALGMGDGQESLACFSHSATRTQTRLSNWTELGMQDKEEKVKSSLRARSYFPINCCCRSVTRLCLTFCNPMDCSMPGFSVFHYLPEFAQTDVHWVNDATQTSHSLSPPSSCPQSFPESWFFSNESALCIRWPKYWSFSFSISPSNEYSGLISYRMNWFDLLAVQGTLKSLLQHHSSKASILWCSAFFMVQLSHLYMTAGKTIAVTIQTFVSKVMSLLFNVLSRLVIAFLPRSKCL